MKCLIELQFTLYVLSLERRIFKLVTILAFILENKVDFTPWQNSC